jgi:hypothetical protein
MQSVLRTKVQTSHAAFALVKKANLARNNYIIGRTDLNADAALVTLFIYYVLLGIFCGVEQPS